MADFICPACDHRQTVPDAHIGKTAKCPQCRAPSVVGDAPIEDRLPEAVSAPPREASEESADDSPIVLREPGGSVQMPLSHGVYLNAESTLQREFITVIHKGMPAGLTGCVGVTPVYEPETETRIGSYHFTCRYSVKALEDIHAFEARFLLFNVWGRRVRTLTATEIADIRAGEVRPYNGYWSLLDENDACEHYASIAYIAAIRAFDGKVYRADSAPVIAEAKRFSSKFNEADLDPTPTKQ